MPLDDEGVCWVCCFLLLIVVGMAWLYRTYPGVFWTIIGIAVFVAFLGIIYWAGKKVEKPEASGPRAPPPMPTSPISRVPATIRCSSCGFRNPTDHAFCGRCGAPLLSEKEETRIYE